MDLFGDKLKEIRLGKEFTLEQIARETKISRKFLEAIETNDFSVFPSETYLIGFLRTYTEYLGLDSTKYINQYRNYKIQEQPIPINELLDMKKRIHPVLIVLLIVLGIGVVATGSILVYRYFFSGNPRQVVQEDTSSREPEKNTSLQEYYFKDEVSTHWFFEGDRIYIPLGEKEYLLEIVEIGDIIKLSLGDSLVELTPEQEVVLNLNNDDNSDIKLLMNQVEMTDNGLRVNLGLYKVTAAITSTMTTTKQDDSTVTETVSAEVPEINEDSLRDSTVIFESEDPEPFEINIQFEGQCLFRYLTDNKTRYQKFFQKNDPLDIEVSKQVKMWISNAGSVSARISGTKVAFGKPGQIVTKMIRWHKDTETEKYKLELSSIY